MLERTSRFVLEVLPYLLTGLIAAVIVPQLLYSQAHPTKAVLRSNVLRQENALAPDRNERAELIATRPAPGAAISNGGG